jgi:hypothetical protein
MAYGQAAAKLREARQCRRFEMVIFGIPLAARSLAGSWDRVTRQLSATVGSIYSQSDGRFRIVVAGSDEPRLTIAVDDRYEFLPCAAEIPIDFPGVLLDIARKRHLIAARAGVLGGGYLMFVDSDDLVNSRIVEYVNNNPHPNGYRLERGFIFDAETGALACYPMPGFEKWPLYRICGSSSVVRFTPDELPGGSAGPSLYQRIFGGGHRRVPRLAYEAGRPLADLPFRGVAYVRGTGENASLRDDPAGSSYRFHMRLRQAISDNRTERTAEVDLEFGLPSAELPSRAHSALESIDVVSPVGIEPTTY